MLDPLIADSMRTQPWLPSWLAGSGIACVAMFTHMHTVAMCSALACVGLNWKILRHTMVIATQSSPYSRWPKSAQLMVERSASSLHLKGQ